MNQTLRAVPAFCVVFASILNAGPVIAGGLDDVAVEPVVTPTSVAPVTHRADVHDWGGFYAGPSA